MRRWGLLLACLALAGCALAQSTPEMHYYVLATARDVTPRLDAPVRVGEFTIADPYATRQIAYRTSPYVLAYYNYHRWAGRPQAVVANAVREYLERASHGGIGPAFEVVADVRQLEEVDEPGKGKWQGAIALDLVVTRDGKPVLARSFAETEAAETRSPEAVVAAISRALGRIMEQVVTALAERGATEPAPAP
jgi:uncharacterized lipoprotein YmbA